MNVGMYVKANKHYIKSKEYEHVDFKDGVCTVEDFDNSYFGSKERETPFLQPFLVSVPEPVEGFIIGRCSKGIDMLFEVKEVQTGDYDDFDYEEKLIPKKCHFKSFYLIKKSFRDKKYLIAIEDIES